MAKKTKRLAIIGAGASGMCAAIFAARELGSSCEVVMLERMDRVGKKLLATGNGRCNLTNVNMDEGKFHGGGKSVVGRALKVFGAADAMAFFEELGVVCAVEEEGKVYPASFQASSVLDSLRAECEHLGVIERVKCQVEGIRSANNSLTIEINGNENMNADAIIVAAGGCSSGALGSDGSLFKVMRELGHGCSELYPSLVQIKTDTRDTKSLDGIKCIAEAKIFSGKKELRSEYGEVLFTKYGLSGPPILQLSSELCNPSAPHGYCISLNLFPQMDQEDLYLTIAARVGTQHYKPVRDYFTGWVNKRIGLALLKTAGIEDLSRKCSELDTNELRAIARTAMDWRLKVQGAMPFSQSQVTAGGIYLEEFSNKFKSLLLPNLYACGEILDVHGDCGGYNLQWAWTSGFIAGTAAAKSMNN